MTDVPRLSLKYPNGRTHEVDFDGEQRFNPGDEFDLYGRRWRVVSKGTTGGRRYGPSQTTAIVCRALTASTLPTANASEDETRG